MSSPHARGSSHLDLDGLVLYAVVPARAGVIRTRRPGRRPRACRPRTRGGHPHSKTEAPRTKESSPHARGSSVIGAWFAGSLLVVPARAGVIQSCSARILLSARRPRTRGGHPTPQSSRARSRRSSPHARGSSLGGECPRRVRGVVPARAGVIPTRRVPGACPGCRPRTRGGHPGVHNRAIVPPPSSPHARGSSAGGVGVKKSILVVPARAGVIPHRAHSVHRRRVVPARAGVIRRPHRCGRGRVGRPRTRGGHPWDSTTTESRAKSSPHARGSSVVRVVRAQQDRVVPARAGVILGRGLGRTRIRGRPRTRGGHPADAAVVVVQHVSSPHARGSSPLAGQDRAPLTGRPRTRGGHPTLVASSTWDDLSSPHARGSSAVPAAVHQRLGVVPARAGVIPAASRSRRAGAGRPRTRGGHPVCTSERRRRPASSPHARGSSNDRARTRRLSEVVPARAGVILGRAADRSSRSRRPRTRGGHPEYRTATSPGPTSSPHARGSSASRVGRQRLGGVVPARAGVIPG